MKLFEPRDLQLKPRVLSTSRGLNTNTKSMMTRDFSVRFPPDSEDADAARLFATHDLFGPRFEIEQWLDTGDEQNGSPVGR